MLQGRFIGIQMPIKGGYKFQFSVARYSGTSIRVELVKVFQGNYSLPFALNTTE
jgi:hypothetical protein